ncbi:AimR family lysis-lysogeny pheromone receptor [Niallia alba]|uniref:AimR family lysis-lysogeny pheromone receptor n=1 Tax=Niallia alba TaxID=2729105 RepID=UPI002E1EE6F2|nr:AimR family lysis-lysogeny pheromone receptor [Niallia alba]
MKTLRQRMMNDFESERGLATRMAKLGGYASAAKLKSTIAKEDGEIQNFGGFIKIVHDMYPEEKFDLMDKFADTLNSNKQTIRYMLEYVSLYRLKDAKKNILKRMFSSSSDENREWAYLYNLDWQNLNGHVSGKDAITELSKYNFKTNEMLCLSKIMSYYFYEENRNLTMMNSLCKEAREILGFINNKFVKNSLQARLFLVENTLHMHFNKLSRIKELEFLIENALDPIKANVYLTFGNMYMLTNYDKSINYLYKAMELASTDYLKNQIVSSLNFLYVLHEKCENYIETKHDTNKLFLYCKQGNTNAAEVIFSKQNIDEMSSLQKGFNFYYKSLLYKSKDLLYTSIMHFNNAGDKFYKQLAVEELKKYETNHYLLEALGA